MNTLVEIESAIEALPPREQRELFDFLAAKLASHSGVDVFPDLEGLFLDMPNSGEDADFKGVREPEIKVIPLDHPCS